MKYFLTKARVCFALGLSNILQVIFYRVRIKLGFYLHQNSKETTISEPFFVKRSFTKVNAPPVLSWQKSTFLFGHFPFNVNNLPPNWFVNPLSGESKICPNKPWWLIPDFDPSVGDIKLIWELSRMDWVLAFSQRVRNGDMKALRQLNNWLADWIFHNPPYFGPNWKCGQEASIRVMHLAIAAIILEQEHSPPSGLVNLIKIHLERIFSTFKYAIAQNNNHGTSEAAALFIGGSWLQSLGDLEGKKWENTGRYWLENRAKKLIGLQGSFSQYSLNYHRAVLDTYSIVEIWRRQLKLPSFSLLFQERIKLAVQWLQYFINPINGDGPNLGANDGANFLPLTNSEYRDFRPSIQLAMALFLKLDFMRNYYIPALNKKIKKQQQNTWNDLLTWLNVAIPRKLAPVAKNLIADDGGFAILRRGNVMAMLRYPRFKFRPSQSDILHLDLWVAEKNVLRDAGSYSYNSDPYWENYFGGTVSHNTIEFDGHDQMPRLSRFLFGDWLKTSFVEPLSEDKHITSFGAGYRDQQGIGHHRTIQLSKLNLKVKDEVFGFKNRAITRWRLSPSKWNISSDGNQYFCESDEASINNSLKKIVVSSNVPIVRCEIVQGWESRFYQEKRQAAILEVEVMQYGNITTDFNW